MLNVQSQGNVYIKPHCLGRTDVREAEAEGKTDWNTIANCDSVAVNIDTNDNCVYPY